MLSAIIMKSQPDLSRRRFLRGKNRQNTPARPPWSVDEHLFLELCSRCGECVKSCSSGLLVKGSGGFPEADFSKAACDFCGICTPTCTTGALTGIGKAWQRKPVTGESCLSRKGVYCRTCAEACDHEVITFQLRAEGMAEPEIDAERCTSCGECSSACPVMAIELRSVDEEL